MRKKINVLIFPAGEINSVELHEALSHNVNVGVFGASSTDRHGPYVFKNYCSGLPNIADSDFVDAFNALIAKWSIDLVFPTHDTVARYFAENREKLNAKIIVADTETSRICRSKKLTYELFADCDFCPKVYGDINHYPCFIKPDEGQGSVGARLLRSREDIPSDIDLEGYVAVEYLPGGELTVDCITDMQGRLQAVLPRSRDRVMAGVSVAARALPATPELQAMAETINSRFKFCGLWFFQVKEDVNGKYKLLEISTRCAGTMCLSRARGVNLPLLSVYAATGKSLSVFENPCNVRVDRTLISRYSLDYKYDTVYIDYDDTVVEGDAVCLNVIRFLYQCHNDSIRTVLLTRHETDHEDSLEESLKAHAISPELFSEIIHVGEKAKTDFIRPSAAIFIDNAYAERKKVHDFCAIPVFDVEGIEVLTDWRC